MRALALCLLVLAGCSIHTDPCAGKTGVCVGLRVVGSVSGLDQLSFTINDPGTTAERSPNPAKPFSLPVKVALFPPAGTMGTVHIYADGYSAGGIVAHGDVLATLANGRAQATLTLTSFSSTTDMAVANDLIGADLEGQQGDGAPPSCSGVTMCHDDDGCCPGICNNATDNDCKAVCGNNVLESGEVCDDGNNLNGDGCDPTCRWLGNMRTLSGTAGAMGYADGPDARFGGFQNKGFGAITTDGTTLWVLDSGTNTIRTLTPGTVTTTTIIGSFASAQTEVDGPFATARLVGTGTPSLVYLLNKLYFTDGTSTGGTILRVADLAMQTVSPVPVTVVKNTPISLAADETNAGLYYIGQGGELDRWIVGDSSSTVLATASTLQSLASTPCDAIVRSKGLSYLRCGAIVLQVTDNGGVTLYAGTGTAASSCADNINKLAATFSGTPVSLAADSAGDVFASSCAAIREINSSGVTTVSGELNMPGYSNGTLTASQFGDASYMSSNFVAPLPFVCSDFGSQAHFYVADSANASIRDSSGYVQTIAGSSPAVNAVDVRGNSSTTRYPPTAQAGMASDGTNAYFYSSGNLVSVDLSSGTSANISAPGLSVPGGKWGNAVTVLGGRLYVAAGTIESVKPDGSDLRLAAGGTNLGLTIALTSDGTDLYYLTRDSSGRGGTVNKLVTATQMVEPIAGTANTTDIVDGVGTNAHFDYPRDLAYANGKLYSLDGSVACCSSVLREIDVTTHEVRAVASANNAGLGQPGGFGDQDGVGANAHLQGQYLASDGNSVFISDYNTTVYFDSSDGTPLAPTIRQFDPRTGHLTTFVGQRGQWTISNGTGVKALVHYPGPITVDAKTHAILFFDQAEGVVQTIR